MRYRGQYRRTFDWVNPRAATLHHFASEHLMKVCIPILAGLTMIVRAAMLLLSLAGSIGAPFVGIWRFLTTWNVLEFKGPTDDPALRDLDLLLEVGLGIDRRLNEEERRQGRPVVERDEVAWWYLANHVGARFRAEAERLLGGLAESGEGLWRGRA